MRQLAVQVLPDLAMIAGAGMILIGIYLLLGLAIAMIVAGCGLATLGYRAGR
jgi:hypothetical protein